MSLRRLGVIAVIAVVTPLLMSGQALTADEPANLNARVQPIINPESGTWFPGAVPVGRDFLLYLVVERAKLPTDSEDDPISTAGGRSATYAVDYPAGLEVQPSAEVSGYHGLSSTCTSGCRIDIPEGRLTADTVMLLRATAPGRYRVTLRLTAASHPDPVPENNTFTREFTVAAAVVTAGRAVATPGAPRAGRKYSLILPLTLAGVGATPNSVRCSAKVGKRSLTGVALRLSGRARCTWKLSRGTAGKTLRAKLVATAGGKTFSVVRTARVR